MPTLELKVCNLDGSSLAQYGSGDGKFVVSEAQNGEVPELGLHCLDLARMLREKIGFKVTGDPRDNFNTAHYIIAGHYKVSRDQVLGGGYYSLNDGMLTVDRDSTDFGPVPMALAADIGDRIAARLKELGHEVKFVSIAVSENFYEKRNRERWQKLGYCVL